MGYESQYSNVAGLYTLIMVANSAQRIRIDRESEAIHDLIRELDKPDDRKSAPIIRECTFRNRWRLER